MVMTCGGLLRPPATGAGSSPHEAGATQRTTETGTMHERLVAYVRALDSAHDRRCGVWTEHSYARGAAGAGGGGGAHSGAVRVLLAPRDAPDAGEHVDVTREEPPPPEPPLSPDPDLDGLDAVTDTEAEEEEEAGDWESRVTALAPHAEHAQLAGAWLESLRRVRLARLAGGRVLARSATRDEARRLRLALAPLATWTGGSGIPRPGAWVYSALSAYAPRRERREVAALVSQLRRLAPRVAQRLTGLPGLPAPAIVPRDSPMEVSIGPDSGPWLIWVGTGRWARSLGALVHTRALPLDAARAPPDVWCACVAGSVRAAFADILASAGGTQWCVTVLDGTRAQAHGYGQWRVICVDSVDTLSPSPNVCNTRSRPVIVGGAGAGAILAHSLAREAGAGSGVRGALLLAPALRTAEGDAGPGAGAEAGVRVEGPALIVAGGAAAQSWRGALCETLGPQQRLLLVDGCDDALRLPGPRARRAALPPRALDAAIAEECARWIHETCEAPEEEPEPPGSIPVSESEEEEYAHLPAARAPPQAPQMSHVPQPSQVPHTTVVHSGINDTQRTMDIAESRVVSRVSGGTPLALLPPRRAEPRPDRRPEPRPERRAEPREPRPERPERRAEPREPRPERRPERSAEPALAVADIMDMPIVFADDEPRAEPPEPRASPAVTVRSGASGGGGAVAGGAGGGYKYTRVIVAKRGAAGGRPLLLRRGVRLVPRDPHHQH